MGKEKKGGKRMNKQQLTDRLMSFFQSQPDKTFTFKDIFRSLKLNTHPLKMLAIDTMEELSWDDVLTKVGDNAYRLSRMQQVAEGRFMRKANGKNVFIPTKGALRCSFQSEIRCRH